jgi:hypothetical protein
MDRDERRMNPMPHDRDEPSGDGGIAPSGSTDPSGDIASGDTEADLPADEDPSGSAPTGDAAGTGQEPGMGRGGD